MSVPFILELMGAGSSEAAILASYPQLTAADIRACLRCARANLEPKNTSSIDDWILGYENEQQHVDL